MRLSWKSGIRDWLLPALLMAVAGCTASNHLWAGFGLDVCLSSPALTAGRPVHNRLSHDKRGRKGDWDVPFCILSITTLRKKAR